jgi:Domain of unknown function (DUF5666)
MLPMLMLRNNLDHAAGAPGTKSLPSKCQTEDFMRLASSSPRQSFAISLALVVAAAVFSTGCGSSAPAKTVLSGNTNVSVLLTSTGNDQLSEFDIGFLGITLTSQSGKTATLLPTSASGSGPGAEFVEINGTAQPLVTTSVPQDIYTAATVTLNGGQFVCIQLGPDDGEQVLDTSTYNFDGVPASSVTVNLPSPITVTGASMGLSLDLLVAQSATYSACFTPGGFSTSSLTPTFNLTPLMLSPSPTNASNGKVTLDGQVTAIGTSGNTFTLSLPDAEGVRSISVGSNSSTVYEQGINSFSALAVGTFVDMDGAIQSDGSLLATRVAVEDPAAADIFSGPIIEVAPSVLIVNMLPRQQQGQDFVRYYQGGPIPVNFGSAIFQISGQLANLGNLPFVPSFSASSMVPGQDVYFSVATYAAFTGGPFPTATTMTLMPQTIDATVVGSSTSGSFTDYTVSLASYDLFPNLAVQPGQTTVENNPSQVEVYVDTSTQMLNTQPLTAGSTLRFYGLVFNDNGTLRMDCAQVNDGVDFSPQPTASQQAHMEKGAVRQTRREGAGSLQQTISVTVRAN